VFEATTYGIMNRIAQRVSVTHFSSLMLSSGTCQTLTMSLAPSPTALHCEIGFYLSA